MPPSPTCLIFSPHLDDAVFSCAGILHAKVADGWRVVVATVFSEGAPQHAARRAEDAAALAYLGAEPLWLGFLDAPWRDPYYTGFEQIILGRSPGDDSAFEGVLARSLQAVVDDLQPAQLLVPLGVGTHVDHRLVFDVVFQRLSLPRDVVFRCYEERPYAYAEGMVELRLRQLGFAAEPVDESRLLTSFRQLPYVKRYLPAGPDGARCERLMLEQAARPGRGFAVRHFCCRVIPPHLIAAQKAAALYASQFADFCGSESELIAWDQFHGDRFFAGAGRVERLWNLFPGVCP